MFVVATIVSIFDVVINVTSGISVVVFGAELVAIVNIVVVVVIVVAVVVTVVAFPVHFGLRRNLSQGLSINKINILDVMMFI